MNNSKLLNIEFLRCFAVLTLVAWHSLCVYVGWIDTFPDIKEAVGKTKITEFYTFFASVVLMPDANMPLFTAISGFVYSYLFYNREKYRDLKEFLKNKSKRLLIPYFVIGTIVVFTIFDWEPYKILTGEAHHLWYCIMLFWCFLYVRIYQIAPPPIFKVIMVAGCLVVQLKPLPFDVLGIVNGLRYFPYFIMGYYLAIYLCKLRKYKWALALSILVWLLTVAIRFFTGHLTIIVCYTYTFMLFLIVPENIKVGQSQLVSKISEYSFGIYVFHEWFLWNMAHLDVLHPFIIRHQILYPLLAYTIVLGISILLTKYSLKMKTGRFLLGG